MKNLFKLIWDKKQKEIETYVAPKWTSWEENAIEYNRMHGLPDDAI